jgi:hypothetical protein
MTGRKGNGWADVLGEELGPREPGAPEDLAESLRSPSAAPPRSPEASADVSADDPNAKTVVEPVPLASSPAPRELEASAPPPALGSGSWDLPLPSPPPASPPVPAAPVAPDFSPDKLVEGLASGPAASSPKGAPGPSFWAEYKEVVLTGAVGLGILGAAVIYTRSPSPAPSGPPPGAPAEGVNSERAETPPEPRKRPAPPARPAERTRSNRRDEQPQPTVRKAATPMLSVVTVPSGALVEIDGVIYGRSPLIMPSPKDRNSLDVTLKLDDHQPWNGRLRPNRAGHFNLNVELEPFRSR